MKRSLPFKRILRFVSVAAVTSLAMGLAACGGGGSGSGSGSSEVRSLGEIDAMGSIFVNGVKYETEGAQIVGLDHTIEDLKPGRVVLVDGRVNDDGTTGNATGIKIEDSVKGPLTSFVDDGTIAVGTVMGQTVIFEDNLTKFDPVTGLPTGDDLNKVFVVSGFEREDNTIQATFAQKLSDDDFATFLAQGGILEVKGAVGNLDTGAQTFQVNGLTVDYSAAELRNLPAGGLADGLLVEVKGDAFNAETNTLTAIDIEGKAKGLGDDIAKAEVQGFISNLNAGANTFDVNGQSVNYANATFRAGIEADLANGVKVEAEGPLSGGTLQATRVTFKESVRIEADVEAISGNSVTLQGLPGISIAVHPELTRGANDLSQLSAGNEVKIRAREAASGLIATRLERIGDGPGDRTELQGPVTAVNNPTVTILGTVDVNTSSILDADFKDHDRVIGRSVFFQTLQEGDIVKARFRNGAWDQIEFQD